MKAPKALIRAAENAIRTCRAGPSNVLGNGEVPEVARLVLNLPDLLVQAWRPHLIGGELDIIGVFSHKTPLTKWKDPPNTGPYKKPELCDLMIVLDLEKSTTNRKRFALLLQAKVANASSTGGVFTLSTQEEATQRQLYANQPNFTLTKPTPPPREFNVRPLTAGECPGMRYACVNVKAALPSSGWWIEDKQPKPAAVTSPVSSPYTGTFNAAVPLGEALHDMVTESRGALLSPGSEWERLVATVERAALDRTGKRKGPSGVHAAASGTVLPNVVAASLFLTRANEFFDSKGTLGFHGNWEQLDCADMPPGAKPPLEPVEPQGSGFGILYIRLINPEWRDDD